MKRQVIDPKYQVVHWPFGTTAISYLLFQQLKLSGTMRGAVLVLLILWNVFAWVVVTITTFTTRASTPVFKEV